MGSGKFDFKQANSLVQALEKAAATIEVKNGQMEKKFMSLHEFFRDEGYTEFEKDMSSAQNAIDDIVKQLYEIGKYIAEYAQALQSEI